MNLSVHSAGPTSIRTSVLLLFICLFGSVAWGQLLHPADNAAVREEVLSRRWPNGVIPYIVTLDSGTSYTEADFDNDRTWEILTLGAVRFVKRTTEDPYIEIFINDTRSASDALRGIREWHGGKISGKRRVKVEPDGSWHVNHELGHVIGLWHQQRHYNSQQCVTTNKEKPFQLPPHKLIGHYSTDSIMHYRATSGDFVPGTWNPACPQPAGSNPTAFDAHYVMKMYGVNGQSLRHTSWCSEEGKRVYMGDFNGDGLDDLLCHAKEGSIGAGHRFIDYASLNQHSVFLGRSDWSKTSNIFCRSSERNLMVGDFNGDGRDDLFCHDTSDGRRFLDYANSEGHLNGTNDELSSFCAGPGKTIYLGDFDGRDDGADDMLCHTKSSGAVSIDFAWDGFGEENWSSGNSAWCKKDARTIVIGDFDSDKRDDMMCYDKITGHRWIDYANNNGHFRGADWNSIDAKAKFFCTGGDILDVHAADVDGDGRDDLLCHGKHFGDIWVDFASSSDRSEGSQLRGANVYREISFCNSRDAHLYVARLPKNNMLTTSVSLFCHNRATGHQAARYDFD